MPLGEYEPTERIVVLREHLEQALAALKQAYNRETAFDLAEAYRQGTNAPAPSPLAKFLANTYNHLEGYLNDTHQDTIRNRIPAKPVLPGRNDVGSPASESDPFSPDV